MILFISLSVFTIESKTFLSEEKVEGEMEQGAVATFFFFYNITQSWQICQNKVEDKTSRHSAVDRLHPEQAVIYTQG